MFGSIGSGDLPGFLSESILGLWQVVNLTIRPRHLTFNDTLQDIAMSRLVRATSLANFAEVARQLGLQPEKLLATVGLDAACLHEPDMRISSAAVLSLLENSAAAAGNSSFGLLMAESRRLSDFGAISLLFRHQATLRSSLDSVMRYREYLNEALTLRVDNDGHRFVLSEEINTDAKRHWPQAIELAVGVMVRLLRTQLGYQWTPTAVCFRHRAPTDIQVHQRVFGLKPTFQSAYDGIEFPSHLLDQESPGTDPVMLRYAQQLVDANRITQERSLAMEVRDSLRLLLPNGSNSIDQIAKTLGYATRTLQRRLDDQGQSYSDLLIQVRRELACTYLADHRYSLDKISQLLGFAQLSVFSRWFRYQFGCAPQAWRKGPRPA
jgi:AraC-like DNA-binding protein